MSQEWKVYKLFVNAPEASREIIDHMKAWAKTLIKEGELTDFYYNVHYIPQEIPPHIMFGFYQLRDVTAVQKKIAELGTRDKITKVEPATPDLNDVDGVEVDKIKLAARKITEIINGNFKDPVTIKQIFYLIHFAMNPLFGYVKEREIYWNLTLNIEKAIREHNILPKEKWLSYLDNFVGSKRVEK